MYGPCQEAADGEEERVQGRCSAGDTRFTSYPCDELEQALLNSDVRYNAEEGRVRQVAG